MTTDATRLREFDTLAEVDIDALIRNAHLERSRLMAAHLFGGLRAVRSAVLRSVRISPRVQPAQ